MSIVRANFDAAPVLFEHGTVTGPPGQVALLDQIAGDVRTGNVTPEGPAVNLHGWRGDPWAFVAVCRELDPSVTFEMSADMPALDRGSEGGE